MKKNKYLLPSGGVIKVTNPGPGELPTSEVVISVIEPSEGAIVIEVEQAGNVFVELIDSRRRQVMRIFGRQQLDWPDMFTCRLCGKPREGHPDFCTTLCCSTCKRVLGASRLINNSCLQCALKNPDLVSAALQSSPEPSPETPASSPPSCATR